MQIPWQLVAAAAAAAALAACKTTPNANAPLAVVPLLTGEQTGLASGGVRVEVARTEADWLALWQAHSSISLPSPAAPPVDFENQQVVFVGLGMRPTPGYQLELFGLAKEGEGKFVLRGEVRGPDPDTLLPQVVTQPFQMVLTPRLEGSLQVVLEQRASSNG